MAKKQSGRGRSATLDERYVHDAKVLPVSLNFGCQQAVVHAHVTGRAGVKSVWQSN